MFYAGKLMFFHHFLFSLFICGLMSCYWFMAFALWVNIMLLTDGILHFGQCGYAQSHLSKFDFTLLFHLLTWP
jgi:hypothetical protein